MFGEFCKKIKNNIYNFHKKLVLPRNKLQMKLAIYYLFNLRVGSLSYLQAVISVNCYSVRIRTANSELRSDRRT